MALQGTWVVSRENPGSWFDVIAPTRNLNPKGVPRATENIKKYIFKIQYQIILFTNYYATYFSLCTPPIHLLVKDVDTKLLSTIDKKFPQNMSWVAGVTGTTFLISKTALEFAVASQTAAAIYNKMWMHEVEDNFGNFFIK